MIEADNLCNPGHAAIIMLWESFFDCICVLSCLQVQVCCYNACHRQTFVPLVATKRNNCSLSRGMSQRACLLWGYILDAALINQSINRSFISQDLVPQPINVIIRHNASVICSAFRPGLLLAVPCGIRRLHNKQFSHSTSVTVYDPHDELTPAARRGPAPHQRGACGV